MVRRHPHHLPRPLLRPRPDPLRPEPAGHLEELELLALRPRHGRVAEAVQRGHPHRALEGGPLRQGVVPGPDVGVRGEVDAAPLGRVREDEDGEVGDGQAVAGDVAGGGLRRNGVDGVSLKFSIECWR